MKLPGKIGGTVVTWAVATLLGPVPAPGIRACGLGVTW
jgi:hypothetical protein